MANINVTMTVDTTALASGSTPAQACILHDSNGDPDGSTNFVINANQGDTVTFSIAAKDGVTPVAYSAFRYEGGTDGVFDPLPSSANSWVGTAAGTTGESENYYIDFVSNGNPYTLDPKIQIDT
ncbi:hypothetical protein SAMN04488029_2030 [Reichenbachiella faecimaris]|uniref:Uncharacterized protein n=1 Tax=Reichenbachiella faecimaris TaxID=692418 RepID=A0A1W2GCT0_REIFA|nr:hypothetical protein [Reichenbachiella faecimaris]SMD34480.1 hypothetical protein SAMN04488029_2030 [Reichenbachiella faecimaris]